MRGTRAMVCWSRAETESEHIKTILYVAGFGLRCHGSHSGAVDHGHDLAVVTLSSASAAMEASRGSGMDSEVHDDPDEAKTALHSAPPKKRARTGSHREDGTEDAVATTIASSSRPVSPAGMLQEATEQTRAEWHDEEEEEGDGSTTKMYCICQALFGGCAEGEIGNE